jgi:hypothetical protein
MDVREEKRSAVLLQSHLFELLNVTLRTNDKEQVPKIKEGESVRGLCTQDAG